MTATNILFATALIIGVSGALWTLTAHHRDRHAAFSFDELLVDPKTLLTSPARCMLVGGFAVGSFIVIYQTFTHTLTDIGFGAYLAAFVTPAVTKIVTDNGVEKAAATTTPTTVDNSTNVDVNGTKKDT